MERTCLRLAACGALGAALWSAPAEAQVTNLNTSENFATISAAIADADTLDGHVIEVSDGTYVENVPINKSITLRSVNGRASTTIQGISSAGALGAVTVTNNTNGLVLGGAGQGFTILGIDNGNPGIENAAVYFQGGHSNAQILSNEICARGDAALMTEFGAAISGFVIDDNIFSGSTFFDPPAGTGFGSQFTLPNVPRQLVVMGCGAGCASTSDITFTNNQIVGTAGGVNISSQEQGNTLVTLDAAGVTVSGNTFAGTTTRFGSTLRCRGTGVLIDNNTFDGSNQTATTNYMFLQRGAGVLSVAPETLADVVSDNDFSPPAVLAPTIDPYTIFIGFNALTLEIGDCPDDTHPGTDGYQIEVELWMRGLSQNVTGFAAFLAYDTVQLNYEPTLSSYSPAPFDTHISGTNQADDGTLQLDGSYAPQFPPAGGTDQDALLATLVFTVSVQCGAPDVAFDLSQPFDSELSFQGTPVTTVLIDAPSDVTLDDTPPVIASCAPSAETYVVDANCEATVTFTSTVTDNCGIDAAGVTPSFAITSGNATVTFNPLTDCTITQVSPTEVGVSCSALVSDLTGCPAVVQFTLDAVDNCGNIATCVDTAQVVDNTAPEIVCSATQATYQVNGNCQATVTFNATITDNCCVNAADVSGAIILTTPNAEIGATSCLATQVSVNEVSLHCTAVVSFLTSCPATVEFTVNADDCCDNAAIACVATANVEDAIDPTITCPDDISVDADAGGCTATLVFVEPFDNAVPLCATQTPNCYYVDRYPPAGFASAVFGGGNRLRHSISSADSYGTRPPGYQSIFYNTQGRKYDVDMPVGSTLAIDLFIPSSWATDARRADIWATAFDAQGAISGFPIVGFVNNDPADPFNPNPIGANLVPRFRIFTQDTDQNPGNGYTPDWVNLGLPVGFAFDTWNRLEIELTATSFVFNVDGPGAADLTFTDNIAFGSVRLGNAIIQAYSFSDPTYPVGDSYDVYWDNFTTGPKGPIALDNCCIDSVTYVRSDNPVLTWNDPFPQGVTTVTWTVEDCCGNQDTCAQTVTVSGRNQVHASVTLVGVNAGAGISRCIKFIAKNGLDCADPEYVTVNFTGNPATGTALFDVECGFWTELCAKDEQHTMYNSVALTDCGAYYSTFASILLNGGDNDNDSDVDINDVTWLLFQFGSPVVTNPTCIPWTAALRDADYSNDGAVTSLDYTFITNNWLDFSTCPCAALSGGGGSEPASDEVEPMLSDTFRTARPADELPADVADRVDLNRDGVVDFHDVKIFEDRNGLSHSLSNKIEQTANLRSRLDKQAPAASPLGDRKP